MSYLSSLTKDQWLVLLVLLALNVVCIYGVIIPLVAGLVPDPLALNAKEPLAEPAEHALVQEVEPPAGHMSKATALPAFTRTPTRSVAPKAAPVPTRTPARTSTPRRSPTRPPPAAVPFTSPRVVAELELSPKGGLGSKTSFFTSACFGQDANPLQDRDYMAPADWSSSPDRKCIFGYGVKQPGGLPTGRYAVHGGPDGVPRFYVIPPEAFAQDQTRIKQLSEVQWIVDTDQGCDALGSIGVTADGYTYQCSACAFFRAGGVCPGGGGKSLALPTNQNHLLEPDRTGGAYGFLSYPLVFFRKGFSLYFTGRAGYAPPRIYFENAVDTLAPGVNLKTTAEMTGGEIKEIARQFDSAAGVDPLSRLAPLEQEAQLLSSPQVIVRPKETGALYFSAPRGAVLSSIVWKVRAASNQGNQQFMEANFCLEYNGEEVCFTGVEDFAHCAFYTACRTGYSSLVATGNAGYVATRYFPAGSAPVLSDSRITAQVQAPDIGTVLEMEVKVRVRMAPPPLTSYLDPG